MDDEIANRIFLTGFMGAGKTTTGRILAEKLGFDFFDLDVHIELTSGKQISGIFEELGEGEFRELERQCLKAAPTRTVIATGGGCFIHNADWMLANGKVVHLHVPFDILAERIGADPKRPLWRNAEKLFRQREDIYSKAHLTVDASPDPETVALTIQEQLK